MYRNKQFIIIIIFRLKMNIIHSEIVIELASDTHIGKVYSGAEFNALLGEHVRGLYKITNRLEEHYEVTYQTGLMSILPHEQFNPTDKCCKGGLYCFHLAFLFETLHRSCPNGIHWIRKVTIPDDAQVYIEKGKYKCSKFIVSERKRFFVDDYVSEADFLNPEIQNDILMTAFQYVQIKTSKLYGCVYPATTSNLRYFVPESILEHRDYWFQSILTTAREETNFPLEIALDLLPERFKTSSEFWSDLLLANINIDPYIPKNMKSIIDTRVRRNLRRKRREHTRENQSKRVKN